MPDYTYPEDGKFHTRPSELTQCTSAPSAMIVANQRIGVVEKPVLPVMEFGKRRHRQFEEQTRQTGAIPEVFRRELGFERKPMFYERTLAVEVFPGVVIHFTPDFVAVGPEIVDYKTTSTDGGGFASTPQMPVYGYCLTVHGIHARKGHYLIEQWDRDRESILGYRHIEVPLGLSDFAAGRQFIKDRVELLMAAEEVAKEQAEARGFTDQAASRIIGT